MEDVPGGVPDPPPKFQSDRMHGCAVHTKIVILFSFLLVGEMGMAVHSAYLVEDMPGGEADPPTKFDPCMVILGSFLLVGVATPSGDVHPANLVEDVPRGEANPPTNLQPDRMHGCAVHAK